MTDEVLTKAEAAWYRKAFIIEVVQKLRETPGKLAKEDILRHAIESTKHFKEFLRMTYSPTIRYNVLKIPTYRKAKDFSDLGIGHIIVNKMLDVLITRKKTGEEAAKHLTFLLESLNGYDAEALELMIGRDIQAGCATGSINRVCPKLIPEYPVMLCEPWDDALAAKIQFPAYSQIKMDGARGNIIVREKDVSTRSRNGKEFGLDEAFAWLGTKAPGNYVLDGEFLVAAEDGNGFIPRKEGNGILNKCAQGKASASELKRVTFVIWDEIELKNFDEDTEMQVPYNQRFAVLTKFVAALKTPQIQLVETRVVNNLDEVQAHYKSARARKLEGVIFKSSTVFWKNGRSKEQLKVKAVEECDLLVVGMDEGVKKNTGRMGALVCESADGKLKVAVGTGFTDVERQTLWDNKADVIGKIVAVQYNEKITRNKREAVSLFLPRFIEIRTDKTEADTLDKIK